MITKMEDTICYKITLLIEDCNKALTDTPIDIIRHTKLLHDIRVAAQKMEDGLSRRKAFMTNSNLEQEYQKEKKVLTTPPGINKVANTQKTIKDLDYKIEFIVKEKGEIVYQVNSFAGVVSTVENIGDIDATGAITGSTQKFVFGPPLAMWYAFNQLEHEMEGKRFEILAAIKQAVNDIKDPAVKKRLLDVANNRA